MDLSPTEPTSTPAPKPTRAELGEARGSGIIVARRNKKGKIIVNPMPFEHMTRDLAIMEASKLAKNNPGTPFMVLVVVEAVLEGPVGF